MSRIAHHRPQDPDTSGQFRKSYHLEMISDRQRTEAIFRAVEHSLRPDSVFCELGCGTAIFTIYAAGRCRKVYAIELDPVVGDIAEENIRYSPFADRITLIRGDAAQVNLPEQADVIFAEMMSIWTIEEPQVPVFNRAYRDFLKPSGVFLPRRIVNLVELGYYDFKVRNTEIKAAIPLFTGIARPAVMTEKRVCKVLDFSGPVDSDLSVDIGLEAIATGPINCACLYSVVQMGSDVIFSGSDSLMPPTVVPLEDALTVSAGARLRFVARARARTDMGDCVFRVYPG